MTILNICITKLFNLYVAPNQTRYHLTSPHLSRIPKHSCSTASIPNTAAARPQLAVNQLIHNSTRATGYQLPAKNKPQPKTPTVRCSTASTRAAKQSAGGCQHPSPCTPPKPTCPTPHLPHARYLQQQAGNSLCNTTSHPPAPPLLHTCHPALSSFTHSPAAEAAPPHTLDSPSVDQPTNQPTNLPSHSPNAECPAYGLAALPLPRLILS